MRKQQNNRVVPFLARDPSSAESATYLKKKMNSLIQNTFSASEEERQLLAFVVVQKVRFSVFKATSSGPF